jgi:hypothetical protein
MANMIDVAKSSKLIFMLDGEFMTVVPGQGDNIAAHDDRFSSLFFSLASHEHPLHLHEIDCPLFFFLRS